MSTASGRPVAGSSPLARGLRARPSTAAWMWGIIPARAGFTGSSTPSTLTDQDHPRSRGVYDSNFNYLRVARGSSPLARGLPPLGDHISCGRGIIPARAGFTLRGLVAGRASRDHPRSRGVYNAIFYQILQLAGSSPLARGLLQDGDAHHSDIRIIPARAGFTEWLIFESPDHSGSSPLARGLPTISASRYP